MHERSAIQTTLVAQKQERLGDRIVVRDNQSALAGRDGLVGKERERAGVAERARMATVIANADGLRRVLDDQQSARSCPLPAFPRGLISSITTW